MQSDLFLMERRANAAVVRRGGRKVVAITQNELFLSIVPNVELIGVSDERMGDVADSSFLVVFLHFGQRFDWRSLVQAAMSAPVRRWSRFALKSTHLRKLGD